MKGSPCCTGFTHVEQRASELTALSKYRRGRGHDSTIGGEGIRIANYGWGSQANNVCVGGGGVIDQQWVEGYHHTAMGDRGISLRKF